MATLALGAVGAAVGGTLLPAGIGVFGATIGGAALGRAVGSVAGAYIDNALFGASGQSRAVDPPSAADLKVSGSTEGAPIARLYGRARLPGQMIWATSLEYETVDNDGNSSGGKGVGGGDAPTGPVEYRYFANVAFGLCEGEITRVGRIWADGKELSQSDYTIRVYKGTETQEADSLIEAKEGEDNTPAYRGLAYVVFERMPLARFGNHIPQLSFEVFRSVDAFEDSVRAVTVIPSAGEFVYESEPVRRTFDGASVAENVNSSLGGSDWSVSMDQLEDQLPSVQNVSLFVSWFGDDLRAGHCRLRPKVDRADKTTEPLKWGVAGLDRSTAAVVSRFEDSPAYGGTPTDASVISAIQDLKARGQGVTFTPFILMDVASGNDLVDPYSGAVGQPAYPWRGRISIDPAPGVAGSVDKTSAAAGQISNFVGTASVSDFSLVDGAVEYTGPTEWSYRRMILHYAYLCQAAGGVDAFLIGSEMRGLTQSRDGSDSYPFVAALAQLAADVKFILGAPTKVTYAADWSEYFGHQPTDGSGDVYFHLDPLWASSDIDAIGIDVYWPLSDWREGGAHLDSLAGASSIYDLDYLTSNITGGEGFDWYYASSSDRDNQVRTPITDGSGKPWVFRYKDIKAWWENAHYNRPGGVEDVSATAWVPQSKPIWFTEIGCPAVDKGANQPNVFVDPKSSETAWPYHSRRVRDDLIQRRYLQSIFDFFNHNAERYQSGANPQSSVYGGRMVDIDRIYAYSWDARPYPAFPQARHVWADGGNWEFGHWLSGRVAGGPLAEVVSQIMLDYGFERFTTSGLTGILQGYVIERVMAARDALQPLELAFFFDSIETGGLIAHVHRGRDGSRVSLKLEDLVETKVGGELFQVTRGQETELSRSANITYVDGDLDYRQAAVVSRRLVVNSDRVSSAQLPMVMSQQQAQQIAESWLQESWSAREQGVFALPPSQLALEPGDLVTLNTDARSFLFRVTRTEDGLQKSVETRSIDPGVYDVARVASRDSNYLPPVLFGPSEAAFLDLPLLSGNENAQAGWVAAYQSPWPGGSAFYRSASESDFSLNALVTVGAVMGVTEATFSAGPVGVFDRANNLRVRLMDGELTSLDDLSLLEGGNLAAVQNSDGGWEVLQFKDAALVGPKTYELTNLLRGQGGSEDQMSSTLAVGAIFVLLNSALVQVDMKADDIGRAFNWKYGPSNLGIGDSTYQTRRFAFSGRGLKPLAPGHIRGERLGDDLNIRWFRRTRVGGDSWEVFEVPLGEDVEAYELDVLNEGAVVRTLSSFSPDLTYSSAQQIADFGGVQESLEVRVYQISSTYGRGIEARAIV